MPTTTSGYRAPAKDNNHNATLTARQAMTYTQVRQQAEGARSSGDPNGLQHSGRPCLPPAGGNALGGSHRAGPPGNNADDGGNDSGGGSKHGRPPSDHDSDCGERGPRGPARRRHYNTSDEEDSRPKKREREEVKIATLPSTSVDYESWWAHEVDIITACAHDPNEVMTRAPRIPCKDAKF